MWYLCHVLWAVLERVFWQAMYLTRPGGNLWREDMTGWPRPPPVMSTPSKRLQHTRHTVHHITAAERLCLVSKMTWVTMVRFMPAPMTVKPETKAMEWITVSQCQSQCSVLCKCALLLSVYQNNLVEPLCSSVAHPTWKLNSSNSMFFAQPIGWAQLTIAPPRRLRRAGRNSRRAISGQAVYTREIGRLARLNLTLAPC